jgi:hypothetical protein
MRWLIASVCACVVAAPICADGLVFRLPEDGTSARFSLDLKVGMQGVDKSAGGYLAMSSVGKETVDGQDCRWIEFKMVMEADGKEEAIIAKALLQEKGLKTGENPSAFMIRGWVKRGSREPEALNDVNNQRAGPLAFFLSGPPADNKKLDKAAIDTKLGKLDCEGVAGTTRFEQGAEKVAIKYATRLHEKAPFGVVETRMEFQVERDGNPRGQGELTLKILELTQGAKSELPDQK